MADQSNLKAICLLAVRGDVHISAPKIECFHHVGLLDSVFGLVIQIGCLSLFVSFIISLKAPPNAM